MNVLYTPEFKRRYQELPSTVQKKAERRERMFRQNPFHPSLGTEKLRPREKEYWGFRIDKEYRMLFRFRDDTTIYLVTCGHHKWIYRYILTH